MASRFVYVLVFTVLLACNSNSTGSVDIGAVNDNGRNDAWGFTGFGGGGAMFYPAVSPFNSSFAFVACDMTGSYVTYDGGEKWRMFNLGDPVKFFVFDPVDSNVVYANTGALFKSANKGNTWKIIYPAENEIADIISKGDHATTVIVPKDSIARRVTALAVDPLSSEKLYAGITLGGRHAVYSSPDGGKKWQKEADTELPVKSIFAMPETNGVYATTDKGIYNKRKSDWQFHHLPGGVNTLTTFSGGYDNQKKETIIYAIAGTSYFNSARDSSGVFYTRDGGKTWENRQAGLTDLCNGCIPEWRTIATSALHPDVVYVSYNNFQKGDTLSIGVAKSKNYGISWSLVWEDRFFGGGYAIASNFSEEWINKRFGPSWGENPFSIGVSPANPDVLFATDFGRTIKTEDGGKTWEQVYTRKTAVGWASRGLEVTTSYDILMNPFDSAHLFICNTDIGLMESIDAGHSWRSATENNGVPRAWVNSTYWMVFDPEIKGRAWAVMSGSHDLPRPKMWRRTGISNYKGGILQTNDAGKNWEPLSIAIGEGAFTHILLDPESNINARTLYACGFGKGVYKSEDGGKSWQQKNKGLPATEPFAWRIHRRTNDGALFLVLSRRSETGSGEGDGALYISKDGAESWTKIALPAGTNGPTDIMTTDNNPGRMVLSAWGRNNAGAFAADTGGGIYISDDEGATWKQVMEKDQHVHDVTFDKRIGRYYACGFNSSAWRSDDAVTWQRIQGYNFKWGKRVVPDPHNQDKVYIITFGGGIWHGPANGDGNAKEDIIWN